MKIEFVSECTSTNQILIERNCEENVALVAFSQSLGRGRRGRAFFSPKDTGIYLSIFLHPRKTVDNLSHLTTMMAVAAAEAIEETTGVDILIKWVNDLYVSDRKVGGILTECSPYFEDGIPTYVVVGVGVNVYEPKEGFPEDIKNRAGAVLAKRYNVVPFENDFTDDSSKVLSENESRSYIDIRKKLAINIVNKFMEYYEHFKPSEYLDKYRAKSFLVGRKVKILAGESVEVLGIDDDFGLMVKYDDGRTECLRAGEVSLIL